MRIGILGSGLMGGKLGTLFANAGHQVVFSYARSEQFIKSILTLPPIVYSDKKEYVDMVFYNIKDGETVKSETVIFGDHKASTGAIIEHSNLRAVGGKIVEANGGNIEENALRAYT